MAKSKVRVIRRYFPKRSRRRSKNTRIPILPMVGLASGMIPSAGLAMQGNYSSALAELGARYAGYNFENKIFNPQYALINGWLPFIAGVAGHMVASKLGVNRAIAKVPMIGKWVEL